MIVYSAEEFGYLMLPAELATGSSIMPHKRNPDLFELTRGRAGAVEGDLIAVLQIKGQPHQRLSPGFPAPEGAADAGTGAHRRHAGSPAQRRVPLLEVDRARCTAALAGGALATDEVMRRVESGRPFPYAYREVKEALSSGEEFSAPSPARIIARRRSTGGLGDLGLAEARTRLRRARAWSAAPPSPIRMPRCDGSRAELPARS